MQTVNATLGRKLISVLCALAFLGVQGCATIMTGGTGAADIRTNPTGAKFTILRNGEAIHTGVSPQVVQLKKRGKYSIKIEMEGYDPMEVRIRKGVSAWYILGNLIFGGLIGYLIVDPLSGAMFTFPESHTSFVLTQKHSKLTSPEVSEGLIILSMKDVPQELRSQLVPIPAHLSR